MKGKGIEKENSLLWLVKAPWRLLIMARNAYIRSITSCSGVGIFTGGGSSGFGQGQLPGNFQIPEEPSTALPRCFTLTSTADDQGCLSLTTHGGQPKMATRRSVWLDHRRNYRCVAMMRRIDEEIPLDDEFQEEDSFLDFGIYEIVT
ncbi:PREDICTED: uncharacterized protein LOC104711507 [Camelina sativa]|uniref:Uncharacterized protein LOC104711505 n=1 Tax=Camelina sativa TaxID=90675 RepID=A0ABM0THI0_CAMSA|nr:PREDICTED: uncharacterized protein LOC104711505 [Camelina sativa]XP_010426509.1 PREDICTED: uncharacterized protein LOC104711507 [Camelina sativa]